jgi:hypothetical protein
MIHTLTRSLAQGVFVLFFLVVEAHSVYAVTNHPTEKALERHEAIVIDRAMCGNGNDFYDGGPDTDTLTYSGKRSDYTITLYPDNGYIVSDKGACVSDTDSVINIERFAFKDRTYTQKTLKPDYVMAKGANLMIAMVKPDMPVLTLLNKKVLPQKVAVGVQLWGAEDVKEVPERFSYTATLYEITASATTKSKEKVKKLKQIAKGSAPFPTSSSAASFNFLVPSPTTCNDKKTRWYKVVVSVTAKMKEVSKLDNEYTSRVWRVDCSTQSATTKEVPA